MQQAMADDNWDDDARDLVKPAKTPRFHEAVVVPWLNGRSLNVMMMEDTDDDEYDEEGDDDDFYYEDDDCEYYDNCRWTFGEHRFREFQLVGCGDGAGGEEGRVPPWWNADDDAVGRNGDDTAAERFLSFLFRGRNRPLPVAVVVWLSPRHFVAATRERTRCTGSPMAPRWRTGPAAFGSCSRT
jgi:hypothetical protein